MLEYFCWNVIDEFSNVTLINNMRVIIINILKENVLRLIGYVIVLIYVVKSHDYTIFSVTYDQNVTSE